MRSFIGAIAASVLLGGASPALSQAYMFETGSTLLNKCSNKTPQFALACTAYIAGVVDGIRKDMFIGRARPVCWPDRMTIDQARATTVAYLNRWPDQRKAPASVLVSVALNEKWPCGK